MSACHSYTSNSTKLLGIDEESMGIESSGSSRKHGFLPAALLLGGLAVSVPFLVPYHNYPLLTFYGEWMAFLIGLLMAGFALLRLQSSPALLPWISVALLGLCVIFFAQIQMGLVAYPQRSVVGVIYAFWAAVMAWAGLAIRKGFGLERASVVLAGFLAAGGWLMSITGYMQYFQIETAFGRFIEGAQQVGMYGVLAQRNLFANYVACGLVSVGFLLASRRMGVFTALLLGIPMAAALSYSGSRGAWVYVFILLGVLACMRHVSSLRCNSTRLPLMMFGAGIALTFVFFALGPAEHAVPRGPDGLAPWEWLPYRAEEDLTQTPIAPRLLLAWHAWLQFKSHIFLGVGFGEYPWNLFLNTELLDGHFTPGIDRHAHNLALHLLAETGFVGFAMVFSGIVVWLRGIPWQLITRSEAWLVAVVLIQGAHSFVEFPLWYSPFLGMTCLLIGLSSSSGIPFGASKIGRMLTKSIPVIGVLVLALYLRGYREYEEWYLTTVREEQSGKMAAGKQVTDLLNLKYAWMFSPYFDLVGSEIIVLDRTEIEAKLALNSHAMRMFPIPSAVFRQAILLAMAGRDEEAWEYWRRLRIVYPKFEMDYRNRMIAMSRDDEAIARLAAKLESSGGRL